MSIADVENDWRDSLRIRFREAAGQPLRSPRTASFRFGDAVVDVVSDFEPLLEELDAFYGDCADSKFPGAACHLRFTATLLRGSQLLSLSFDGARFQDLLDIALGPYRFLRRQPCVVAAGPGPGWRVLLNANTPGIFLVASDTRIALINLAEAPPEFVTDCIVSVAQSAQSGVLFLHAASVGINGAGALLLGASQAGKSTNALALAWRGHAFLGDDMAAVRLATREVLPFAKSAGLREGPLAQMLGARVQACRHVRTSGRDGILRNVLRVSDLFPGSGSGPLPLRFAFVLDGLKDTAKISPLKPGYGDLMRLRSMVVIDTNPAWGRSPGRDLMQLLTVLDLLSGLRCYLVELGSTEETASLIENAMRA